jgi:glycosyltransferase involved in cell wall biosynthesis
METVYVSLTSIKSREQQLRLTLESLIKQDSVIPYLVHIYLSRDPHLLDEGYQAVPVWPELNSKAYQKKVRFHFVRNTGPYRKLLPLLSEMVAANNDSPIVTCDDDTIYPSYWLRNIIEEHNICCGIVAFRGHTMTLEEGKLSKYNNWLEQPKAKLSLLNLATGKDGILYRPSLLDRGVLDVEAALRLAPTTDDLWFKVHSLLVFCPVRILSDGNSNFWAPDNKADPSVSLWKKFNEKGGNDDTLRALFQNIRQTRGICIEQLLTEATDTSAFNNQSRHIAKPMPLLNYYRQIDLFETHHIENPPFLRVALQRREIIRRMATKSYRPPEAKPSQQIILAIKTWNRQDYLKRCIDSFLATRCTAYQWTLLIADDGSTDGTLEYLQSLSLPLPFHLIKNQGAYACGQFNSLNDLALAVGYDVCFHADDDVVFEKPGWDTLYIDAMKKSGFHHICYRNLQHYETLIRKQKDPAYRIKPPTIDESGLCAAYVDVHNCDGSFFTVTPEVFRRVGYADEANFPIRGQWHIDYSVRCVRAGFNIKETFFDAKNSNDYISLQALSENYRCSLPWGDEYKKTKNPDELARRYTLINSESRIFIPRGNRIVANKEFQKHLQYKTIHPARFVSLNEFVDCAYLINLENRVDRRQAFDLQARRLNIKYRHVAAVDGKSPNVATEYGLYVRSRSSQKYFGILGSIKYQKEFYLDSHYSTADREIFLERDGVPAIASVGAWAYRETYIRILEDALHRGYTKIAIFDDDVLFHDDFNPLFTQAILQLPENWLVWLLGAMQFGWTPQEATFVTENLYSCNGSSVASHATLLNGHAIAILLEEVRKFKAPIDIGPLSNIQRNHKEKCFVSFPNLAIQSGLDSDIDTSTALGEGRNPVNRFRWDINQYLTLSKLPI